MVTILLKKYILNFDGMYVKVYIERLSRRIFESYRMFIKHIATYIN